MDITKQYYSSIRHECKFIGPAGDSEWGVEPDDTRLPNTVYVRIGGAMPRIVFIGPEEQADTEFVEIVE